jgi:hypothetical protein
MQSTSISRMLVTLVSLTLLAPVALADRAPAPAQPTATPAAQPRPTQTPATQAPGARSPGTPANGARAPGVQAPAPLPPRVQLAPIDVAALPVPCKPLVAKAQSPTLSVALPARVSLASCIAEHAIAPLELCDCGASIAAIDAAAAPAIALLDDVVTNGDPASQAIAEHTEGQLYAGFVIRMMATLPALGPTATEAEIALRDMRKQTLELQLAPWREAAMTSFQHVVEIARAHPELTKNPVVATAVRDSERRLAAEVATR